MWSVCKINEFKKCCILLVVICNYYDARTYEYHIPFICPVNEVLFSVLTPLFVFYVRCEDHHCTFLLQNGIRTNALMTFVCFQKPSSHLQYPPHSTQVAICCHKVGAPTHLKTRHKSCTVILTKEM